MASSDDPKGVETPRSESLQKPPDKETSSFSEAWSTSGTSAVDRISAVVESAAAGWPRLEAEAESLRNRPASGDDAGGDEEEGMTRMSFLEHLEELRKRILLAIGGVGVAFFLCLFFSDELWKIVVTPATSALTHLGVNPPELVQISPMDSFRIMWMELPILAAVFLSSPWIMYQVWAFIAPGLYKRERRWAGPFIISSAGLFIIGGLFAYFVAFRYGLEFLMGLAIGKGVDPDHQHDRVLRLVRRRDAGRRRSFSRSRSSCFC